MVKLYKLTQDDQNEVQHDFFGHIMPLTSHNGNGIVNGTITFVRPGCSK